MYETFITRRKYLILVHIMDTFRYSKNIYKRLINENGLPSIVLYEITILYFQ